MPQLVLQLLDFVSSFSDAYFVEGRLGQGTALPSLLHYTCAER